MVTLITYAAGSETGLVRAANEDSGYAGPLLQAVADGMGGHVGGAVASAVVIGSLRSYDAPVAPADLAGVIGRAVGEANAAVRRRTEKNPALRTMGTTLTALLWSGRNLAVAHIGDSRAYLLRDGRLCQITEDHNLGMLMSQARTSEILAPVMARFLDGRPDRSPDLAFREAFPGDRYLLCTDGLSGVVPARSLRDVLDAVATPDEAVRELIRLAIAAGGPDNVTVIVVDVADSAEVRGSSGLYAPAALTLGAVAEGEVSL